MYVHGWFPSAQQQKRHHVSRDMSDCSKAHQCVLSTHSHLIRRAHTGLRSCGSSEIRQDSIATFLCVSRTSVASFSKPKRIQFTADLWRTQGACFFFSIQGRSRCSIKPNFSAGDAGLSIASSFLSALFNHWYCLRKALHSSDSGQILMGAHRREEPSQLMLVASLLGSSFDKPTDSLIQQDGHVRVSVERSELGTAKQKDDMQTSSLTNSCHRKAMRIVKALQN